LTKIGTIGALGGFVYDGLNRRTTATLNGAATSYVYAGDWIIPPRTDFREFLELSCSAFAGQDAFPVLVYTNAMTSVRISAKVYLGPKTSTRASASVMHTRPAPLPS
jgi:hypothetical protein